MEEGPSTMFPQPPPRPLLLQGRALLCLIDTPGDSLMKAVGMIVVSLRGVNCGFWSHLGSSSDVQP